MGKVRFLHISDLHISRFPNLTEYSGRSVQELVQGISDHAYCASHDPGRLKAIVTLAHELRENLDAVVITGDIATTGLVRDLTPAEIFVKGKPDASDPRLSNGFPTLAGTGLPVFILPGNHDRYETFLRKLGYVPGGSNFNRIFGENWSDDVMLNSIVKSDLAVGIVAADFNLRSWKDFNPGRSPVGFYAQGKVYQDILDKLVNYGSAFVDENIDEREVVLIWSVHFPPDAPRIAASSELIEGNLLIEAAGTSGALLIISGHLHYPFQLSSPSTGVVPDQWSFQIFGAGTASQFDSDNHCQVITIDNSSGGTGIGLEHYRFDEISNAFVP